MIRSYGRGFARKAEFTKKCSCNNPQWYSDHVEVNGRTSEITYVLNCRNCNAYWGTKSPSARKYWGAGMDKIPVQWQGYSYRGNKTVRELFQEIDLDRLKFLERVADNADVVVFNAQKEADKAHKEVEKFKKQMEGVAE